MNAPTCTQSGTRLVCTFVINNEFMPGEVATLCQIYAGGNATQWPTCTVGGETTLNAANQGKLFTCSVMGSEPALGTPVSGIIRFGDGSYATFSSQWS